MAKTAAKKPVAKKSAPKAVPVKAKKVAAAKKAPVKVPVETLEEAPPAKVVAKEPKVRKEAAPKLSAKEKKEERAAKAERAAASEEERKWTELYEKHKAEKPQSYDMKASFEAAKPLQHKILGWGWIVSNENDRLEVLFRDGKRILISNYNR